MSTTWGSITGTTVGPAGASGYTAGDIWSGALPGKYARAGKTYFAPLRPWAMDSLPAFKGANVQPKKGITDSFQDFMQQKQNPNRLFTDVVGSNSPEFLLAKMKFGG